MFPFGAESDNWSVIGSPQTPPMAPRMIPIPGWIVMESPDPFSILSAAPGFGKMPSVKNFLKVSLSVQAPTALSYTGLP